MLLGSSSSNAQISLGVRFYLKDQFTQPVQNMKAALKGYEGEFNAFQDNLRAARNVAIGVATAGAAASVGMYRAAMEGAEFLYVMKGVEAITEGTNEQMAILNSLALQLGRQTMFMPEDIASGMRFMAMAGQSADVIAQTTEAFTNLAGATMTQLGGKMGAADIGTNALKAFGWEAQRSAQMSDILVAATTNANVSLIDLGNSIRYVAATSRNLEVPVQETIGLLMSLGNAGIQSSMAGTALENMYRYLARSLTDNASKKAKEAWMQMGLTKSDITTATGNLRPMVDILEMMNEAMRGMDPIQVQSIFRNIFGVRGVRGAATIARNIKEARGFVGMLSDEKQIGGTASEKMKIMMDNLKGASLQLISTWKGLKVEFAAAVGSGLTPLLNSLKAILTVVTDFIKTPIGGFLSKLVFSLTVVTTVVFGLKAALLSVAYAAKSMLVSVGGMAGATNIAYGMLGLSGGLRTAGSAAMGARNAAMVAPMISPIIGPTSRRFSGNAYRTRGGQFSIGAKTAVFKVKPLTTAIRGASSILRKASPLLGGLAMVGRSLLGFLGPIGIGLAILAPLVPTIISAFSKNTDAVEKNTLALTPKGPVFDQEIYGLIEGKEFGAIVKSILDNMLMAYQEGTVTQAALLAFFENGNFNDMFTTFGAPGGVTTEPIVKLR